MRSSQIGVGPSPLGGVSAMLFCAPWGAVCFSSGAGLIGTIPLFSGNVRLLMSPGGRESVFRYDYSVGYPPSCFVGPPGREVSNPVYLVKISGFLIPFGPPYNR